MYQILHKTTTRQFHHCYNFKEMYSSITCPKDWSAQPKDHSIHEPSLLDTRWFKCKPTCAVQWVTAVKFRQFSVFHSSNLEHTSPYFIKQSHWLTLSFPSLPIINGSITVSAVSPVLSPSNDLWDFHRNHNGSQCSHERRWKVAHR